MISVNDKNYYLFEQDRLSSFKYWKFSDDLACNKFAVRIVVYIQAISNDAIVVKPFQLAAAGFYKCNTDKDGSDECVCFYCGKGLGDWDAEDDPFKEHKSHSPNCKFISLGRPESEFKVGCCCCYILFEQLFDLTCRVKINVLAERIPGFVRVVVPESYEQNDGE